MRISAIPRRGGARRFFDRMAPNLVASGREESQVFEVPLGFTRCVLRMPRNDWPAIDAEGKAGEVAESFAEVSFDGGATWPFVRGVGSHGGDYFNRRGDLIVETTLTFFLPQPDNPLRRIRVKLDRYHAVDTQVDLDLDDWPGRHPDTRG